MSMYSPLRWVASSINGPTYSFGVNSSSLTKGSSMLDPASSVREVRRVRHREFFTVRHVDVIDYRWRRGNQIEIVLSL